jgi:hypothetical protein
VCSPIQVLTRPGASRATSGGRPEQNLDNRSWPTSVKRHFDLLDSVRAGRSRFGRRCRLVEHRQRPISLPREEFSAGSGHAQVTATVVRLDRVRCASGLRVRRQVGCAWWKEDHDVGYRPLPHPSVVFQAATVFTRAREGPARPGGRRGRRPNATAPPQALKSTPRTGYRAQFGTKGNRSRARHTCTSRLRPRAPPRSSSSKQSAARARPTLARLLRELRAPRSAARTDKA